MKKKKIRFCWSCSDFVHHEHRWKWTAWLCGRTQWLRLIIKRRRKITMDESEEIRTMRSMAWERVKGELHSVMVTYRHNKNFAPMNELVREFVKKVEDEGYAE